MDINELSEEVKAKLRECKSAEELRALAEEEGIELTDELLEAVSGGNWPCILCPSINNCPSATLSE